MGYPLYILLGGFNPFNLENLSQIGSYRHVGVHNKIWNHHLVLHFGSRFLNIISFQWKRVQNHQPLSTRISYSWSEQLSENRDTPSDIEKSDPPEFLYENQTKYIITNLAPSEIPLQLIVVVAAVVVAVAVVVVVVVVVVGSFNCCCTSSNRASFSISTARDSDSAWNQRKMRPLEGWGLLDHGFSKIHGVFTLSTTIFLGGEKGSGQCRTSQIKFNVEATWSNPFYLGELLLLYYMYLISWIF